MAISQAKWNRCRSHLWHHFDASQHHAYCKRPFLLNPFPASITLQHRTVITRLALVYHTVTSNHLPHPHRESLWHDETFSSPVAIRGGGLTNDWRRLCGKAKCWPLNYHIPDICKTIPIHSHEKKIGHRDCSRWAHVEFTVLSCSLIGKSS